MATTWTDQPTNVAAAGKELGTNIATDSASSIPGYTVPATPISPAMTAPASSGLTQDQINGWATTATDILSYIAPVSGDLSGSLPIPTVVGMYGHAIPTPTGTNTVLTWDGYFYWTAGGGGGGGGGPTGPAGGALSGTYPNPTINLTSNSGITGLLPFANQDAQLMSGDVDGATDLAVVVGLQGYAVSSTAPTLNYVLKWNGSAWTPTALPASASVTGTGLWYSASGTLNSAAITLNGDVSQGALSGSDVPLTVTALQGNAVKSGSLTSLQDGYVLTWTNADSEWEAKPPVDPAYLTVTQVAHGFSTGQAVYYMTGGVWALAQANSASTMGIGIVSVLNPNTFNVYTEGPFSGMSGLTDGYYYFVSATSAGALTATDPATVSSNYYSNPLFFALTATTGIVLPRRPSSASASTITAVSQYDFLLDNDPVVTNTYTNTHVAGQITSESWTGVSANLIKNIAYTYTGANCTSEVRKVYLGDGITIAAQLNISYTFTSGLVTGATYTRVT